MSSLRSSSALCFNVFGPWRGLELAPLGIPFQTSIRTRSLRFEQKFRHGLRSTPPNLDVVLDGEEPRPLAVECKFTEPYGKKRDHAPLDNKYFVGSRVRWTEVGLPRCQSLAATIGKTTCFKRLAAGQLLKHLLGLARTTRQAPRLRYLWFDTQCPEAVEHRAELDSFIQHLDPSIDFGAVTYQDLFAVLCDAPEPIPHYHSYLRARYFAT